MWRKMCVGGLVSWFAVGLGAARGHAAIEHVIHISVDGLRGDLLRGLLDGPGGGYPAFAKLRAEGAVTFNARCDHGSSSTLPNHTSMITGLPLVAAVSAPPWQQHGYEINFHVPGDTLHMHGNPVRYKHSAFDRVHDRGGRTMLLASKEKFLFIDRSYDADHGAPDLEGEDHGRDKIDFTLIQNADSSILIAVLLAHMGGEFPAYTFLHIFDPDYAGHLYGWGSLSWQLAVKHADSVIGLLLSALNLRPALKAATALVITSDHGGGVPIWNHIDPLPIENITIPVMIWGPAIPPGIDAHTLFANRQDPGLTRPESDAPNPPLRNGDTGNIALALLGLPPITDSYHRPQWNDSLRVAIQPDGGIECTWPLYWAGWSLESSHALDADTWRPVPSLPEAAGTHWRYLQPDRPRADQFFRLRAPD